MYISARSNILEGEQLRFKGTWMRISRRAVRDYNFRGTDLLETLLMWYNVRRGEKKYISPYKGRAHVIIDSSLRYEVPVFAHYADACGGGGAGAPAQRALAGVPRSGGRLPVF